MRRKRKKKEIKEAVKIERQLSVVVFFLGGDEQIF